MATFLERKHIWCASLGGAKQDVDHCVLCCQWTCKTGREQLLGLKERLGKTVKASEMFLDFLLREKQVQVDSFSLNATISPHYMQHDTDCDRILKPRGM